MQQEQQNYSLILHSVCTWFWFPFQMGPSALGLLDLGIPNPWTAYSQSIINRQLFGLNGEYSSHCYFMVPVSSAGVGVAVRALIWNKIEDITFLRGHRPLFRISSDFFCLFQSQGGSPRMHASSYSHLVQHLPTPWRPAWNLIPFNNRLGLLFIFGTRRRYLSLTKL